MHRDLKLANLLLNLPEYPYDLGIKGTTKAQRKQMFDEFLKNLDITVPGRIQVKIADLGFARELNYEDLSETMCGTPLVMAPEVLNGKRYNHKADVWSLGIVFFEMLVGFTPFTGRDKPDLKRNLERG
jgi:serine/threonine-protein kinase ULK2